MRSATVTGAAADWDGPSGALAVAGAAGPAQALSGASKATRAAARRAEFARQGILPHARAAAAAATAEAARLAVAESVIASTLDEDARLGARIAELERRRDRAEMRASVASFLMTCDAWLGAADRLEGPLLTLVHGATAMRADVFEEELLRLVAGQDVTLTFTGSVDSSPRVARLDTATMILQARLEARAPPPRTRRGLYKACSSRRRSWGARLGPGLPVARGRPKGGLHPLLPFAPASALATASHDEPLAGRAV